MKVIFLDIDGVLNCNKTTNPRGLPFVVDRRLLARFRRLLDRTGAKVVLSSTWRYDPAGLFSAKRAGTQTIKRRVREFTVAIAVGSPLADQRSNRIEGDPGARFIRHRFCFPCRRS
jgi:hypothetical protein